MLLFTPFSKNQSPSELYMSHHLNKTKSSCFVEESVNNSFYIPCSLICHEARTISLLTGHSSSEQHSVGQGVLVVVGFGVVVVVAGVEVVVGPLSHVIAHCLSQQVSPEGQSRSVLQSEQLQSVLVSHSASPGQLFAAHVSSQLWHPTVE